MAAQAWQEAPPQVMAPHAPQAQRQACQAQRPPLWSLGRTLEASRIDGANLIHSEASQAPQSLDAALLVPERGLQSRSLRSSVTQTPQAHDYDLATPPHRSDGSQTP